MGTGMQRVASILVVMCMWTVLPGCSGDGGTDPTTVSQDPGSPPQNPGNPPPSPTPGGNLPPQTGTFGGGQGKILFAEGRGSNVLAISEFDLATRQVRVLVDYIQDFFKKVVGGVSRANDGTFAVIRDPGPTEDPVILHYRADGTLLHEWLVPRIDKVLGVPLLFPLPRPAPTEGGALSPNGKSIALAGNSRDNTRLEVMILDVQSGMFLIRDLLGASDAPPDKRTLRASTFWSPTGELYVLTNVGLHRVDRTTGEGTLVQAVPLASPGAPVMSPDGRTIYFEQFSGNSDGGTIWSMDITSGEPTRRSIRSKDGKQYSPALSPDREWLLLQESNTAGIGFYVFPGPLNPIGGASSDPLGVSAVRLSETPIDTQNLEIAIEDASGLAHSANGRMVWY